MTGSRSLARGFIASFPILLPFGNGDSHMPVGYGQIPIQAILDILLPDYTGLLIMELRSRYFSDIKVSLDNLSALAAASNGRT